MISSCYDAMVKAIVMEGKNIIVSGIDCDLSLFSTLIIHRNIADYCKYKKAVVLTGDSDFCLFDLEGVLFLKEVNKSRNYLRVVTRSKILDHFNINEYQLFYLSLLRGNDYVGATFTAKERRNGNQKETVNDTLEYVKNNSETRSLEGCKNDYRQHHPRGNPDSIFETYYQQVFMKDVAKYPFNMVITRRSDEHLVTEEGLTRNKLRGECFWIDIL